MVGNEVLAAELQSFMRPFSLSLMFPAWLLGAAHGFELEVRPILDRSCLKCHGGEKVKGKVDFSRIKTDADADSQFELWETVAEMITEGEMPPEDEPQLSEAEKKTILDWYQGRLAAPVEARPGTFQPRRLSGPEYRNTLHSLFGFELNVAVAEAQQTAAGERSLVMKLLPPDPPGASGFINDTHGARLSSVIWDQYSHLSDAALEQLFSRKGREQLGTLTAASLSETWTTADFTRAQAEILIRNFVPRAFRRLVPEAQLSKIVSALEGKNGRALVEATKFELKAVLMSPAFFYRGLLMGGVPGKQQSVDAFELAERLSYFLWEDRPDDELMSLAVKGTLSDPQVVEGQVERMLQAPGARSLAESFGVQWLGLASLDQMVKEPIRNHALTSQPVDFLNYLFTEERPVMEIIDSKITFVNQGTSGFYGQDRQRMKRYASTKGIERQTTLNQRLTLEHAQWRGGILTMPGVLSMNRGPIQRGTWMLRRILGVKLGEPPADVPAIKPSPRGKNLSFRERFAMHRADASCARCHEKIDPLGFSLGAYDASGRFTAVSTGRKGSPPIDTSGQLPTGENFKDFAELKAILLTSQRETIVRNFVERTLSYALCRKLLRRDQPTVNEITKNICEGEGTWRSLFCQVANSLPFRETMIEKEREE